MSILLGEYVEVELLEPMVILCVPFSGAAILFSMVSAPFYIPTSKVPLCPPPRLGLLFSDLSGFIHLFVGSGCPRGWEAIPHLGFHVHFPSEE